MVKNIQGRRYGRLVALYPTKLRAMDGSIVWILYCDCGKETSGDTNSLRNGSKKSCGCLQKETSKRLINILHRKQIKHGHSRNGGSLTYSTWEAMRERCNNPKHISYKNYGAKGVKVCGRWDDFRLFLKDMGERPAPDFQIDRLDNNRGYEPSNCRWATRQEQRANQVNSNQFIKRRNWFEAKKNV